jgi:hypothetical protein
MNFTNIQPDSYHGETSFFGGEAPLSQAIGYIVVLGFGVAFSIFTTAIVYIEKCFSGDATMTSEKFK